jgi:hypothetical protein
MTTFTYKGFGRIYTDTEHIQDVENILREIDENEYDTFYPTGGLVASWEDYPKVNYTYKFDLSGEKFKQICKERNIPVFVFDAGKDEYPSGYIKTLNKEEIQKLSYGKLK